MNKMLLKLISIPWYAIVVGAYAVLSLYASNIQQTYTEVIYKPLLIVLIGSVFLLIIFRFVFGDWHSSAITTAVFNLLFFTYGHLYEYIEDAAVLGLAIGRHRVLIIAWGMIAIIV